MVQRARFRSQQFGTCDDIAVLESLRFIKGGRKIVFKKKPHNSEGGFSDMHTIDRHPIMKCELDVAANHIYNRTIAGKNTSCSLVQIGPNGMIGDYSAGKRQMKDGEVPRSPLSDQTS
ncbi:MAG: hypothetical protein NTZ35_18980 [Ignavibacteriales bacterium]|nr:hypothetical protein [Ignavibacteriales bacterium]